MSEYTSRPRVRTVSASPSQASFAAGAAAGFVLAAGAIVGLVRAAGEAWASTASAGSEPATAAGNADGLVQSPAALREQFAEHERRAAAALLAEHRDPVDVLKGATVLALRATPFHARAASLEHAATALAIADDPIEAEHARGALLRAIEAEHLSLFVHQVAAAAARASREVGFEAVDLRPSDDGRSARLITTDAAGRSLVSEIAADTKGEVNIATEVVGIVDGSCHSILDGFDAALDRQGVRSGQPQRTATGGVCMLPAARDFIRTRWSQTAGSRSTQRSLSGKKALSQRHAQHRQSNGTRVKS